MEIKDKDQFKARRHVIKITSKNSWWPRYSPAAKIIGFAGDGALDQKIYLKTSPQSSDIKK